MPRSPVASVIETRNYNKDRIPALSLGIENRPDFTRQVKNFVKEELFK